MRKKLVESIEKLNMRAVGLLIVPTAGYVVALYNAVHNKKFDEIALASGIIISIMLAITSILYSRAQALKENTKQDAALKYANQAYIGSMHFTIAFFAGAAMVYIFYITSSDNFLYITLIVPFCFKIFGFYTLTDAVQRAVQE